jgi:hypothetical protein
VTVVCVVFCRRRQDFKGRSVSPAGHDYAHNYRKYVKEDTCCGDNGDDNRKDFAAVKNNPQDAKHQGGRKRTHYQQSSKDCKRIASPRPKASKSNKRCDGYDDKESRYFSKTHFELFSPRVFLSKTRAGAETESLTLSV